MQLTTPDVTTDADAQKIIKALRSRLQRWETNHLRTHCAELAERLERAEADIERLAAEAERAWQTAESWREDAVSLVNDLEASGQVIGLTQNGALVTIAATPQPCQCEKDRELPAIGTRPTGAGGTLGAIIARPDGSIYGLIVADAEHETTGEWGKYGTDLPGTSATDGMASTQAMAAAGSAIALAVRALNIDGQADWYIPTRLELLSLHTHAPKGLFAPEYHWSSTQYSRSSAWCQDFEYGYSHAYGKDYEFRARPVRSIQLQPFSPSALPTPIAEGDPREISASVAGAEVAAA